MLSRRPRVPAKTRDPAASLPALGDCNGSATSYRAKCAEHGAPVGRSPPRFSTRKRTVRRVGGRKRSRLGEPGSVPYLGSARDPTGLAGSRSESGSTYKCLGSRRSRRTVERAGLIAPSVVAADASRSFALVGLWEGTPW